MMCVSAGTCMLQCTCGQAVVSRGWVLPFCMHLGTEPWSSGLLRKPFYSLNHLVGCGYCTVSNGLVAYTQLVLELLWSSKGLQAGSKFISTLTSRMVGSSPGITWSWIQISMWCSISVILNRWVKAPLVMKWPQPFYRALRKYRYLHYDS